MRDYITPEYNANAVRMSASTRRDVAVIIEGDTDQRLFEQLLSTQSFLISWGRERALAAAALLGDQAQGVVVIVDADFDRILGTAPAQPFVFYTDTHDAEGMCIQSGALSKILREYGSAEKVQSATQCDGLGAQAGAVRAQLIARALPLGAARLWSAKTGQNLSFQKISGEPDEWISKGWVPNTQKLVNRLRAQNPTQKLTNEDISQGIEAVCAATPQAQHADLCQGHDLAAILAFGLRGRLGSDKKLDAEAVERALRLAFSLLDFHQTCLCADLRRWEGSAANTSGGPLVQPITAPQP
jgi:hypothetical protein